MDEKPTQSRWSSFRKALQGTQHDAPEAATQPQPEKAAGPSTTPVDALLSGPRASAEAARPAGTAPDQPCGSDQERLEGLYRVSRTLGTSLDLDEVLNQVIDAVIDLTGAERGLLVMVESDSGDWSLRLARNLDPEKLAKWEREISRTIITTAIETGKGIVTADAQSDPRFSTQASVLFNALRSMMCAPLKARNRVIGAIYVDSRIQKGIFSEDDLDMVEMFATQAAFALDNARLYTNTVMQVKQLTIELDQARRARQVAEITETDYFRELQMKVQNLREHRKTPPSD
jgi:GAF domain-containing protein